MGIKRPLMILGSTVGAVAAVLSYHPAASGTLVAGDALGGALGGATPDATPTQPVPTAAAPSATPTATATATASATASATAKASAATPTKKKTSSKSSTGASNSSSANVTTDTSSTASATNTQPADSGATTAPTPTPKASATPKVAKDQVVTGATAQTRWGPVQVQITVKDGKIVDAVGLQYPNGDRRSQYISQQAIPWLVEETLSEQIADVQIIGGATYTSTGWRQSLASAMQKAGL